MRFGLFSVVIAASAALTTMPDKFLVRSVVISAEGAGSAAGNDHDRDAGDSLRNSHQIGSFT